jgi:nucleoside-diphosphate-sugar epimerase
MSIFARTMLAGQPLPLLGDGSVRRDFTHVHDICQGIAVRADGRRTSSASASTSGMISLGRFANSSRSSKRELGCKREDQDSCRRMQRTCRRLALI